MKYLTARTFCAIIAQNTTGKRQGREASMGRILKTFHWKDWVYLVLSVGFIVLQVWLDLLLPDYT